MEDKNIRVSKVNAMIKTIGDCGRGFFKSNGNYARVELDMRGRVWWVDDYTKKRIYTHYNGRWRGFSHGGTLKAVVESFKDYIVFNKPLWPKIFGPWPEGYCGGDLWGYGQDMQKVRDKAELLKMYG